MRSFRSPRTIVAFLVLVVMALAAREGLAKSEFVRIIAEHLMLPYDPPCRVCHIQGTTGPGSVQTPFGMSMLAHGLTSSPDSVPIALDAMDSDRTDSDGDSVPDVDELRANSDPNTPVPVALGSAEPTYGCAVAPGCSPPASGVFTAVLLAATLLRWRVTIRRRRAPAMEVGDTRVARASQRTETRKASMAKARRRVR